MSFGEPGRPANSTPRRRASWTLRSCFRLPGRSPTQAREAFLAPLRLALNCVTRAQMYLSPASPGEPESCACRRTPCCCPRPWLREVFACGCAISSGLSRRTAAEPNPGMSPPRRTPTELTGLTVNRNFSPGIGTRSLLAAFSIRTCTSLGRPTYPAPLTFLPAASASRRCCGCCSPTTAYHPGVRTSPACLTPQSGPSCNTDVGRACRTFHGPRSARRLRA